MATLIPSSTNSAVAAELGRANACNPIMRITNSLSQPPSDSFGLALLILSFYAAMPPLPGWPEGPRQEGHYLLINKTLIEAIALLALTFIPTGRWAGLDGLLGLCCKSQKPAA